MEINIENNITKLTFSDINYAKQLFGEHNSNLQRIAEAIDLKIHARGNTAFIEGDIISSGLAQNVLKQLYGLIKDNYPIYPKDIDYAIKLLSGDDRLKLKDIFLDTVYITAKKQSITPKAGLRKNISMRCEIMILSLASGRQGRGKRIWRWLWGSPPFRKVS